MKLVSNVFIYRSRLGPEISLPGISKKFKRQELHHRQAKLFSRPLIHGMWEFDWKLYVHELCKVVGRKGWMRDNQVVIFLNDLFVGDDMEFFNTFRKDYVIKFRYPSFVILEEMGRLERKEHFCSNKTYVFFDIRFEAKDHRLLFELHYNLLPESCRRFMKLCLSHPLKDVNVSYVGTEIQRVCSSGWLQGGVLNYHGKEEVHHEFPDECFAVRHDQRGILSLCNNGRNTNESQFFITFKPSQWMDERYVAIGRLIEGFDSLKTLESCRKTYQCPDTNIVIVNGGVLPIGNGIIIRNEFIKDIVDEIFGKWYKFCKHIEEQNVRSNNSKYTIQENFFEVFEEDIVDVDTNTNYLMARLIKYPYKLIIENIPQYLIIILLDMVMNIVLKTELQEDSLDVDDVSSEIVTKSDLDNNLRHLELNERVNELNLLCISSKFYKQAIKLKKQFEKSQLLKSVIVGDISDSLTEIKFDKDSEKKPSEKPKKTVKIQQFQKQTNLEISKSIKEAIDDSFKCIKITDHLHETDKNVNECCFDPVPTVIDNLLTTVDMLDKNGKPISPAKKCIVKYISIKFIKRLLTIALKQYHYDLNKNL